MLVYLSMIEGDRRRERFASIYDQYKNLMFYAANRILQNEQDAEDVVHEAFLVVIDRLDDLWESHGPHIKAFVLAITEHKAVDLWRRRRHFGEQVAFEEAHHAPARSGEAVGLNEAIACLPADDRALILMRYEMGFTTREIARMLGKKEGAVARAITRAKDRLRIELEKIRKELNAI
ncbi:MAG: sigma-70 family RNA polymerase sigma factor [Clostridia bacterium]|nr:sigma-70 family RNA polymerase sigma factor [Clostridia bacterium]